MNLRVTRSQPILQQFGTTIRRGPISVRSLKYGAILPRSFLERLTTMMGGRSTSSSSRMGEVLSGTARLRDDVIFFADSAPSWEALQKMVTEQQKELNCMPSDLEIGPPSPDALRRTFGNAGEPQIKLYRDHATWCPYCHKIILQLEEKRIVRYRTRSSFSYSLFHFVLK